MTESSTEIGFLHELGDLRVISAFSGSAASSIFSEDRTNMWYSWYDITCLLRFSFSFNELYQIDEIFFIIAHYFFEKIYIWNYQDRVALVSKNILESQWNTGWGIRSTRSDFFLWRKKKQIFLWRKKKQKYGFSPKAFFLLLNEIETTLGIKYQIKFDFWFGQSMSYRWKFICNSTLFWWRWHFQIFF